MPISQDQITTLDQLEEKLTLALTDLLLLRDSNNEDYKVKAGTILQAAVDKAGAELIGGNVESGNNKAVTGDEVANIMNSLPNDAVLHYSFDDIPDIPDGTADVRLLDNNTYDIQSTNYKFRNNNGTIFSAENGNLKCSITGGSFTGCYIPASVIQNKIVKIRLKVTDIVGTLGISIDAITSGNIKSITENGVYDVLELHPTASGNNQLFFWCVGEGNSCTFTVEQIYIGDGSYVTPIIDNVNGQNNGTNNGGIAVQGVSGKGVCFLNGKYASIGNYSLTKNFSISLWVKPDNNIAGLQGTLLLKPNQIILRNGTTSNSKLLLHLYETSTTTVKEIANLLTPEVWTNIVITRNETSLKVYLNGVPIYSETLSSSNINLSDDDFTLCRSDNTRSQTIDDFQIFDRALTDSEAMALYLNKANTPKYYNRADWKLEQIEAEAAEEE